LSGLRRDTFGKGGQSLTPPHTTHQSPDPDPVKLGTGLEHPGAPSEIPGKARDPPPPCQNGPLVSKNKSEHLRK